MAIHKEVVKYVVGHANRPLARRRMLRAVADAPRPYKIEVGAAATVRQGWVGGDITWRTRNYMDATVRWPFSDGSASHVYADNVIEHIKMQPNRVLLAEACRVLQPGGRIRLVTPDVGRLAEIYRAADGESQWHLNNATRGGYEAHHPVDLLRIVFQDAGHHVGYLWDFNALRAELQAAGFVDVERVEEGNSSDPALVNLEGRSSGEGASVALVVEAVRPDDPASPT